MRKIDVMIIGAQKAGTTYLKNILSRHPEISTHIQTEFSYFRDDKEYEKDYITVYRKSFRKNRLKAKIVLAKNAGIYDSRKALERLRQHNPECKIILIMREPVSRAVSSFNMELFNGWLHRDFEELKTIIENNKHDDVLYQLFINLGLYINHIKVLKEYFPENNIKYFLFEDLQKNPHQLFNETCEWLNIDSQISPQLKTERNASRKARSQFYATVLNKLRKKNNPFKKAAKTVLPYTIFTRIGNFLIKSNKSNKLPEPVSKDMKLFLYQYFKPFNNKLQKETGINLDLWRKKFEEPA